MCLSVGGLVIKHLGSILPLVDNLELLVSVDKMMSIGETSCNVLKSAMLDFNVFT